MPRRKKSRLNFVFMSVSSGGRAFLPSFSKSAACVSFEKGRCLLPSGEEVPPRVGISDEEKITEENEKSNKNDNYHN